jgi:hypothetical protein
VQLSISFLLASIILESNMSFPVLQLIVGVVALLLLRVLISEWTFARKAYLWGCGRLPSYPSDPCGISVFIQTWKADKQNQLLRLFERQFQTMTNREGRLVTTFRLKQLGGDSYMTADPQNIQAILATKFKDFDLGTSRRNAFYPLMGHSIVSFSPRALMLNVRSFAEEY